MANKLNLKEMALIGLLGALSAILMLFKFPLPLMPPFLSFELSGLLEIIGGFTLGPGAAILIILVKILVKFVMMGTTSALVGELQNVILSCSYVLPAVWLYDRHKTKKNAVQGMVLGTIVCSVISIFTNLYLIIPFYVTLMGMTWEGIISMCSKVNPLMKDAATMALFGILPFNLIKYGVTSIITFVVYKKISRPMKHFVQTGQQTRQSIERN